MAVIRPLLQPPRHHGDSLHADVTHATAQGGRLAGNKFRQLMLAPDTGGKQNPSFPSPCRSSLLLLVGEKEGEEGSQKQVVKGSSSGQSLP